MKVGALAGWTVLALIAVAGFGTDARGEVYICDFQGGEVYKIVPGAP